MPSKIEINWTDEKKEKVCKKIETWIRKYDAFSGEHIHQDDDCQIFASRLISDLVDNVIKPKVKWE